MVSYDPPKKRRTFRWGIVISIQVLLKQVENHIKTKKHLPGFPSAKEVQENGLNIGEMQAKLLLKIEELTLYVIKQDKKINNLQKANSQLKTLVTEVKNN